MKKYWNFYGPLKTFILLELCKLKINLETLRRVSWENTIIIENIILKDNYISLAPLLPYISPYYVILSNTKEQLLNSRCTRIYGRQRDSPYSFNKFIINRSGELLEPFKSCISIEENAHTINVEIRYHDNYYIVEFTGKAAEVERCIIRYSDGKILDLGENYIFEIKSGGDKGNNICRVTKLRNGRKFCNYFDTKTEKYLLPEDVLVGPHTYLGPFVENIALWFNQAGKSNTLLDPHYL